MENLGSYVNNLFVENMMKFQSEGMVEFRKDRFNLYAKEDVVNMSSIVLGMFN